MLTRRVLDGLLYHPSREVLQTPADAGLDHRELRFPTEDGERLHGWWVPARSAAVAHLLLCHGNAGNVGDRVLHAALLSAAGFDVLLFDPRGFGRSTGRPSERGMALDALAARRCVLEQDGVDGRRLVLLGESLGGAVALELALAHRPAGLVLLSAFTSVRDVARVHFPVVPRALVPDAYPSLSRIAALRAPVFVVHGEVDEIVPCDHGRRLHAAAPGPKRLWVVRGAGHNDLLDRAGEALARDLAAWAADLAPAAGGP